MPERSMIIMLYFRASSMKIPVSKLISIMNVRRKTCLTALSPSFQLIGVGDTDGRIDDAAVSVAMRKGFRNILL